MKVTLDRDRAILVLDPAKCEIPLLERIIAFQYDEEKKEYSIPLAAYDDLIATLGSQIEFVTPIDHIHRAYLDLGPLVCTADPSVCEHMKIKLYDYQIIGATAFLPYAKRCLLADEVGLGKTAQAIGAYAYLKSKGMAKRALLFCKKNLKRQWAAEIQKFTDLTSIVIEGSPDKRVKMYKQIMAENFDFIIVNYEYLQHNSTYRKKTGGLDDLNYLKSIARTSDVIIMDEIQKIKNHRAKTARGALSLDAPYKWGLTGTPIENTPEDLFNIFKFLNPRVLGTNRQLFRDKFLELDFYGNQIAVKNQEQLRKLVAPYMLRRLQKDVGISCPSERIEFVRLEMDPIQESIYKLIRGAFYGEHTGVPSLDGTTNPLGLFPLLLQVANTPLVLKNSSSEAGLELYNKYVARKLKGISIPKIEWIEDFLTDRQYYSSKAKTVIFTRSDDMAKLIADRLGRIFGIDKVLLYIGGLSEHMQQELKQKFWNEAVVIVCTDAAKEGLNLQCADVEINVDLPWNPASLQQRIGRIKRTASQFANVRIINLLSVNSIDERVLQVIYERQNLFDLIVNGNVAPIKLTEDLMRQLA